MKAIGRAHVFAAVAVAAAAASAVVAAAAEADASLWLAVVASAAFLAVAYASCVGFSTLLMVFAGFHVLYGLSGPFAAVHGAPLHPLFTEPYETASFLKNYSLATIGLTIGIALARSVHRVDAVPTTGSWSPRFLAHFAIVLCGVASLMEMVNCIRVGGIAVVLAGKEAYQSLVTELPLDLPANTVAMVATALMGIALDSSRTPGWTGVQAVLKRQVALFILAFLPLLVVVVLLGQRGLLFGWILILLVGAAYTNPIRRLSLGAISLVVVVYLAMGLLYANRMTRGAALSLGDWSAILGDAMTREVVVRALNPAANEFGITLGNFSEYRKAADHELGLGRSYALAFLGPVPSFLYPGPKPQQISFEFRDQMFPGEGERGSIVGTGYSSILEAYYNFRDVGALVVYFVVGLGIVAVERYRARSSSLWFALLYVLALPSAVAFHRSSFGDGVITPGVFNLAVVALLWMSFAVVKTTLARAGGATPSGGVPPGF